LNALIFRICKNKGGGKVIEFCILKLYYNFYKNKNKNYNIILKYGKVFPPPFVFLEKKNIFLKKNICKNKSRKSKIQGVRP